MKEEISKIIFEDCRKRNNLKPVMECDLIANQILSLIKKDLTEKIEKVQMTYLGGEPDYEAYQQDIIQIINKL